MKLKISRENLLQGAQTVCNVVPPRPTLPILANILIETLKDKIQLTGTDLEIGISSTVPAEVLEEGSITTPAKKFMEIVKELPGGEVAISTQKNNTLTIECERAFFKIMGLPRGEFPRPPTFEGGEKVTLPQPLLKDMLIKTSFAMSRDETKYVLNGALFVLRGDQVRVVTTDGRRLAFTQRDVKGLGQLEKEVIIPNKTINELSRALRDEGLAGIIFAESQIMFGLGETTIISRLIEGHFPNYEQVIPKQNPSPARVNKERFLQAIRRVSLLTSQSSQSVKLGLSKGRVLASSRSPDLGEAREEVEVAYDGEGVEIGFNPGYLMDALKNMGPDEVSLEVTGPEQPGVIRDERNNYLCVIMPMQLA